MFNNLWKQGRTAQRSFVSGERSLRAYLAGGNVRFLQEAEADLSVIGPEDKRYRRARFYLGITKAQLRKAAESIEILKDLQVHASAERERSSDENFAERVSLQLAYAYIKTYTDEGYQAAEQELESLASSASRMNCGQLLLKVLSIQAFLYSVMAGRSGFEQRKPDFARKALDLGIKLLETSQTSPGVRFEALNALGIAWMRIAEANWGGFGDREISWVKSQSCYDQALTVVPNSVRVLQNLALLRLIQVRHNFPKDRSVLLAEAKQLVMRSLDVSDQDQYPFYLLAQIAVEEGDAKSAMSFIRAGRDRPGAVKAEEWVEVQSAAEALQQ